MFKKSPRKFLSSLEKKAVSSRKNIIIKNNSQLKNNEE